MNDNNVFKDIVLLLRQGGHYTTKELSERFDTSQRTVQNYVKKLKEISGLQKEGKYYFFPDEFRNVDIHERLQMSSSLMIALYQQAIPELKESVLSNFKELPKEHNAFLFDINFEEISNENLFNQIVNAVIHNRSLSFHYTNKENITSEKNVYPIKVTNMLGYWYLLGYDLESEKVKSFYIKYISDLSSFDESFLDENKMKALSLHSSNIVSPWFCDEEKSVLLKATGDAMLYLKRGNNAMVSIEEEKEEYLKIRMVYYNDTEVLIFVKKWLPFIIIEENTVLKEKLKNILQNALGNYH